MLGWVFAVGGGARVHVHWDGRGVMWGGWNELGWVGIGESLTEGQEDASTLLSRAFLDSEPTITLILATKKSDMKSDEAPPGVY